MPGKGRGGTSTPVWTVAIVPAGTPAEAEVAARRAHRLVAEWIQAGAGCEAAVPVAAQPAGREC